MHLKLKYKLAHIFCKFYTRTSNSTNKTIKSSSRKYIWLFVFLGLVPFSCFRAKYPYYFISNLKPEAFKDQALTKKISSVDTLTTDSMFIKLNLSVNYIAQVPDLNFTNTCVAFKKPRNGGRGLKDSLREIKFSSNNVFNGRPANTNLSDAIKFVSYKSLSETDELIKWLNQHSPAYYPEKEAFETLYLSQRPTDSLRHLFTLSFIFESGDSISGQIHVNWK